MLLEEKAKLLLKWNQRFVTLCEFLKMTFCSSQQLAGVKRSLNDGLDSEGRKFALFSLSLSLTLLYSLHVHKCNRPNLGFPSVLMPVNKSSRTEKSSIVRLTILLRPPSNTILTSSADHHFRLQRTGRPISLCRSRILPNPHHAY